MHYDNELYGCTFGCPVQTRNKECPFNEIEHLSIKEKVIWINSLSREKRESLFEHHLFCSKKREQKQI